MKVDVGVGGVTVDVGVGVVGLDGMVLLTVGLVDVVVLTDGRSSCGTPEFGQPAVSSTTAVTRAIRPALTQLVERRPGFEVVLVEVMPTP